MPCDVPILACMHVHACAPAQYGLIDDVNPASGRMWMSEAMDAWGASCQALYDEKSFPGFGPATCPPPRSPTSAPSPASAGLSGMWIFAIVIMSLLVGIPALIAASVYGLRLYFKRRSNRPSPFFQSQQRPQGHDPAKGLMMFNLPAAFPSPSSHAPAPAGVTGTAI